MSNPTASYSFLPWLRHGLATQITSSSARRPRLDVKLRLLGDLPNGAAASQALSQSLDLYGPGDIQGIDSRAVIRVEPRDWTTNFEPNYLPAIEFYDEDFPWRYTPGPSQGTQLLPWLVLVVLEETTEFKETKAIGGQPLPVITLASLNVLPNAGDLWAWAHVQVNRNLSASPVPFSLAHIEVAESFKNVVESNPDAAYSRIVCPRKLKPNTAYHAFLIPTFESGRLTGLKLPLDAVADPLTSAWAEYQGRSRSLDFPVYFRWYFRTGQAGDFEELVRMLKPRHPNAQVGVRDLSMENPGADLPGFVDPILKLGGALRVPPRPTDPDLDAWDEPTPHPFQVALANFINQADDYAHPADPDLAVVDPVITAPLYGSWHALTQRLLRERDGANIAPTDNWIHELNLDPRYRVPAGYGTRVVQQNQEEFLQAAWEQIGDILEANRRIRLAILAREVAVRWYENHLRPLHNAKSDGAFALTGPLHRRVMNNGRTVYFNVAVSHLTGAATSTALRRILRPRGRLIKSMEFNKSIRPDNLLTRMGQGLVTAARPKGPNKGMLTVGDMGSIFPVLIEECWKVPLPNCPNFKFVQPTRDDQFACKLEGREDPDSESAKFKAAREQQCVLIRGALDSGREPPPINIDVQQVGGAVVAAINPLNTIRDRLGTTIHLPPHLGISERFQEAMAYPRIDKPMYEPLKDMSSDLFLPNFHLIEQNSITLLETNQKFIEAYMVGLNHEFARELLWREYPTDQRGSYFRQFWSVESFLGLNDLTPDARREKLYDIPPLHRWSRFEKLGEHDHREQVPGDNEQEIVLVIRGELLKRYPNTVIYAQRADWKRNGDAFVTSEPRELADLSGLTEEQLKTLDRSLVRTPLYEARVSPDVTFIGFDLTAKEARGGPASAPTSDNGGWFFVLKERPGEPRFGLDDQSNPQPSTVNDLSWKSLDPPIEDGQYLAAGELASIDLSVPGEASQLAQHDEDVQVIAQALSSARWAYLLLQPPVMMAVHASEMLPN